MTRRDRLRRRLRRLLRRLIAALGIKGPRPPIPMYAFVPMGQLGGKAVGEIVDLDDEGPVRIVLFGEFVDLDDEGPGQIDQDKRGSPYVLVELLAPRMQ